MPQAPAESLNIAFVYAHPDDGEFFAAGTLAKWVAAGHKVFAICATRGDLGTRHRGVDRAALAATRERELGAALSLLGAEPPIVLGLPDGGVREHALELRERLIYWFRRLRLQRVVTFDPFRTHEIHPDHIAVGRMASEAAVFSCFPLLHEEHLRAGPEQPEPIEATQPTEVWYMGPVERQPNRVIDIAPTFDKKVASLLCHSSQIEMLADWFVPGADPRCLTAEQRAQLEGGARGFLQGMAQGMARLAPGIELAESFYALRTGPGHFQNYTEIFQELGGAPPAAPELG